MRTQQLLPLADGSVHAIATAPPYDRQADDAVRAALREFDRVLAAGGRLAMLAASRQRGFLVADAAGLGLTPFLDCPIDRKGLPVVVLAWEKHAASRDGTVHRHRGR